MTLIYNDYKRQDILENATKIRDYDFIVNNTALNSEDVWELRAGGCSLYFCIKLFESNYRDQIVDAYEAGYRKIAIDAENYSGEIKYSEELGKEIKKICVLFDEVILLPEDLGGEKYKNYAKFIKGLRPNALLMERTYQCSSFWNIPFFYLRNVWVRLFGCQVFIGLWYEELGNMYAPALWMANLVGGNRAFFYSECKLMPPEVTK